MDPTVEPSGYKPPTSVEELQERYASGERYFERATLGACYWSGETLADANLRDCTIQGVTFDKCDLHGVSFARAKLSVTHDPKLLNKIDGYFDSCVAFYCCDLSGASFVGASLDGVKIAACDLSGLALPNSVSQATVDAALCTGWDVAALARWVSIGGELSDPESLTRVLASEATRPAEGLTLFFNTRLTPFDRFLVDGVIFGVLGRDTDCHVIQFEERGDTAIIRFQAARHGDLEAVADALWERVWEQQERVQQAAVMTLAKGLVLQLQPGLSDLRERLDHIELRLPGPDAKEMLDDQGQVFVHEKLAKVGRCWPEKVARAIGKKAARKVGEEVADAAADAVKGLLKD